MRKLSLLFLPAVIGMMAVGCARIEPEIPENPREAAKKDEILISKSFQAEVAETRTSLEGLSVLFAQGESISIWDGSENREFKADEAGSNVSFSGKVSATATEFYALSPYSASTVFTKSGSTVTAKTTLPSEQTAVAGTFADGLNISAAQSDSKDSFSLDNVLTVVKFNLESANLGGHAVTSVELTSTYPLAGDVTVTYGETSTAAAGANTVNKVTLAKADGSTMEDGSYYFVVLPNAGGEISLKFTASDGYTATRTATLKSAFEAGSLKNLGTVKGLNWEGPKYTKVTSSLSDWTGDYLLVYESEPLVLTGVSSSLGTIGSVEIDSDYTISWEDYKAYNISVEKNGNGYSLYLNGVGYLGAKNGNNLLSDSSVSSDAYRWTISIDINGDVYVNNLSFPERTILCNPSENGRRFCAYKTSSISEYVRPVQFYKLSSGSINPVSGPTVALKTEEATDITDATATLNATYNGLTPINVQDVGFYWGTSQSNLSEIVYDNSSFTSSSGRISATLESLSANTTYYYQVRMMVWDETNRTYVEFKGMVKSFTTKLSSSSGIGDKGWLELPAVTGNEFFVGAFYSSGTNGANRNYSYDYEYSTYSSMWVAYPLYSSTMGSGYSGSWSHNPQLDDIYQVNGWDASYNVLYGETDFVNNAAGTGKEYYARGHQIPNADRNGNQKMVNQTFVATNSTPQIQNQFNASIWSGLEGAVRTMANNTDTVYVVTGPVFSKIGENKDITYIHPKGDPNKDVPVPNYYWKALLKVRWTGTGNQKTVASASAIGFWYDHIPYSHDEKYDDDQFIVSVKQIEAWTGIDLFVNLPGDKDSGIEKSAQENTSLSTFRSF